MNLSHLCLICLLTIPFQFVPIESEMSYGFVFSISGSDSIPYRIKYKSYITNNSSDTIAIMKHNYDSNSGRKIMQTKVKDDEAVIYDAKWTNSELTTSSQLKGTERSSSTSSSNIKSVPSNYDGLQPLTTIGKLTANLGTSHIQGSCFILSNGYIMTAAHCVYIDRQYMTELAVTFRTTEKETYRITESYIPEAWINSDPMSSTSFTPTPDQKNNDWAILKIDNPSQLDIYGATSLITNTDFSRDVYIAFGYPAGMDLQYSKGYGIISATQYRYNLNTFILKGMSGGPVISYFTEWDERNQEDLKYISVVGIISTKEPDDDSNEVFTGITRITNTMIDFLTRLS